MQVHTHQKFQNRIWNPEANLWSTMTPFIFSISILYGGFILPVCPSSSAELLSQYYLVSETFCDTLSLRGTYVFLFCEVRMTIERDRKINYWIQGLNTRESSTSAEDRDLLGCSLRYCLHTTCTNPKKRHINISFIYFMPLVFLQTPWKHHKTSGFLIYGGL